MTIKMAQISAVIFGALALSFSASAFAQESYTLHESVKSGDVIECTVTVETNNKGTTTQGGATTNQDTKEKQYFKSTETVIDAKDGSATQAKVKVSDDSYDTSKDGSEAEVKVANTLAGRTITMRLRPDGSVIMDTKPEDNPEDIDNVKGCIIPDEDYFPDTAVKVGDSWDASKKVSVHSELGKDDHLMAECKLDWVKTIDGKKMGQITCVCGTIRHESDDVENDYESTSTLLVDMENSQIIKADETGSSHEFSSKDAAVKIDIKGTFTFQGEGKTVSRAATQP